MHYLLGLDGGGSSTRAGVFDTDLHRLALADGPTANPSVVGYEAASRTIQDVIRAALTQANVPPEAIAAAGIGVAGADAQHSADWLQAVLRPVLPEARIAPSSDYEIALTGAAGARRGVLVLAGTGSLVYGVTAAGKGCLIGGWGYLLGDEGGGYWLAHEALQALIAAAEGRGPFTTLTGTLLTALELTTPRDLVGWLYHAEVPRTRDVAALAPLVLQQAESGDTVAAQIVGRGAAYLAGQVRAMQAMPGMAGEAVYFAGGLLGTPNALSRALVAALALPGLPQNLYPPLTGAAILARLNTAPP